jgi:hypothetical protein
MIINGSPINGSQINGVAWAPVTEPEYVVAGISYRWRLRVLVEGDDLSNQVLGVTDIDREGGAAGVGGLELHLPPGPVVPTDWVGRSVTIDFLWTAAGVSFEDRRYTGQVMRPMWDSSNRVISLELTDNLQQRVESLSIAEIDALTGGYWSPDVFSPTEGRSRWDYAQERMSTRTASLDSSPAGALRVSSWYASATPDYVFGAGATLDGSVDLELPDLSRMTNQVVIEADYRYTRLRQRNEKWKWYGGTFCGWYFTDTKELPSIEMVEEAVTKSGSQMMPGPEWDLLPPSAVDPCGLGAAWFNNFDNLLLGAEFETARRWAQPITERYSLTLEVPTSISQAGAVVSRTGTSFEVESAQAEAWSSDPFTEGTSSHTDERDEARRLALFDVLLNQAQATLVGAHRGTRVTLSVPTPMAAGIDLVHTLKLDDLGVLAQGRVIRVRDVFDHDAGTAITAIDIAVMRGGGEVTTPLVPPPSVNEAQPDPDLPVTDLPTQLGNRPDAPPYDDELPGFSGNYSIGSGEVYPRRFDVLVSELEESKRDELPVPISATYQVAIPNDLLEL